MPSTASTTYADYIEGKLIVGIQTDTTSGVTVKIKQINGATPTWPTAAHRIKIVQKTATNNKVEKIGVAAGTTQSGQTVTLGTLTRALSLSDGTNFSGSAGTAQTFAASADVFITWDNHDAAQSLKGDIVNTLTGSGAIRTSSTTTPVVRLGAVTTTQRDLMSAGEGDLIKNSTTGTNQQYVGGAWVDIGDTGTNDASTTVAGKVEEATLSELSAGTAAGGTSARLFVNPSLAKKTSSGAAEGNFPILNSSAVVDATILGTGSSITTKYLRGDNTWQTLTAGATITLANRDISTADLTTTSATFVDIDGTNLTASVSCTANTILVLMLTGGMYHTTADSSTVIDFSVGGAVLTTNGLWRYEANGYGANILFPVSIVHAVVPGSGTHTCKPQWKTDASTAHLIGSGGADTIFTIIKIEP